MNLPALVPPPRLRRLPGAAGVTLMELLIAVSLVGLLSVGMLMAVRTGLNTLEKTNQRLLSNRKVVGVERTLYAEIAGIIPVVTLCGAVSGVGGSRQSFFQGESQSMRFVSSYSLDGGSRGRPRILEFQVVPLDEGHGVRLIVNETLYTGPLGTGPLCLGRGPDPVTGAVITRFAPIQVGPSSFVLADHLAYCHFLYRDLSPDRRTDRWLPVWSKENLPTGIRVEMASLPADGPRLAIVSVTVPIHITRFVLGPYED